MEPTKIINRTIYRISKAELKNLSDKYYSDANFSYEEKQMFITDDKDEDNYYTAIDNSNGYFFVENFKTRSSCLIWLLEIQESRALHAAEEIIAWCL